MPNIFSFSPIADTSAKVLILGSMPGKASLEAGQYYAYPHNLFWPIMGEIVGVDLHAPYEQRAKALKAGGIALWDVLKSCRRGSSLDSDIDESSIRPNDFKAFFRAHPRITHVFFNGGTAERCFRKYVLPSLDSDGAKIQYSRLPSTSSANASWSPARKRKAWAVITCHSACRRAAL